MRMFNSTGSGASPWRARTGKDARILRWSWGVIGLLLAAISVAEDQPGSKSNGRREGWKQKAQPGVDASVVKPGDVVPPRVVAPCAPGKCPFAGQKVTVIVSKSTIAHAIPELKAEFEAATGATLEIVQAPHNEHFENFISDASSRAGVYDASIAGAWWLGDLVAGDYIMSYDKYYNDPRFPKWNVDDVLPAPRNLLFYGGKKYMVANDHDGQVMYYRRDLLSDPQHRAAFKRKYGYAMTVPATWAQFHDVAEYFNGKDLNADGTPDNGVTMALKAGGQAMFHFMSLSAPFVIGRDNPKLYWFDPQTMKPLIESAGHVQALTTLVNLVPFGPKDMLTSDLGKSWDHFLTGRAALAFSWGDLGALAQQEGSKVKGKIGTAPMPGTREYFSLVQQGWVKTEAVNVVGNNTGGSWAGVISKYSKAPEATYYVLALMATKEKSEVYAVRGWDGLDLGRYYHFLPPNGTGRIETYLKAGWNEADIRDYTNAYFQNFSNKLQFPYLRIPGAFSYWQALDIRLAEAVRGQLSPEAALKATAIDFEEITIRLGRERQRHAYRASLEF